MKIYNNYFPVKSLICQMNIHYACISRLLHIHSLEDTGDKFCISKIKVVRCIYPGFQPDEWMQSNVMNFLPRSPITLLYSTEKSKLITNLLNENRSFFSLLLSDKRIMFPIIHGWMNRHNHPPETSLIFIPYIEIPHNRKTSCT